MLTDDQVKRLFVYCEKKHVRYYDLQIELVDHLATAIEQAMVQQPGKIFEEIAGEKAPVFAREWKQIEQEKRKILSRGIWRQWRKELLAYFTWPKISLLVLLSSLVFFIDQQWHFHRFPRFGMSLLQRENCAVEHPAQEKGPINLACAAPDRVAGCPTCDGIYSWQPGRPAMACSSYCFQDRFVLPACYYYLRNGLGEGKYQLPYTDA